MAHLTDAERLSRRVAFVVSAADPQHAADRNPSTCPPFGQAIGDVRQVQVLVRDNNVDQALKALKKKMQREGVFREMKLRRHYEKPSERRAREAAEAVRRARKMERKRLEREGF
jgi:small subunit ribosomal protein S21